MGQESGWLKQLNSLQQCVIDRCRWQWSDPYLSAVMIQVTQLQILIKVTMDTVVQKDPIQVFLRLKFFEIMDFINTPLIPGCTL